MVEVVLNVSSCSNCPNETSEIESTNKRFLARISISDYCGGAIGPYITRLELVKRGIFGGRKNVLSFKGRVPLKLNWVGDTLLIVGVDATAAPISSARVLVTEWEGVKIEYRPWLL
jgi:hypothetical protein